MEKLTAPEKRFNAIKVIADKYFPESNEYRFIGADRDQVIAEILALKPLGRTDRWKTNADRWVKMINEHPADIEWAIMQGVIYAGYAAE
jgi:hypothetical protein